MTRRGWALLAPALLWALATGARADATRLEGFWIATDSAHGTRSLIELFVDGSELKGRIVAITDRDGQALDPICDKCGEALRGKKVVGATFIWGLKKEGERWKGGRVIDLRPGPLQGVEASCELDLVDGRARIYGYLGLRAFGRESVWDPAPRTVQRP
jgi:hypothetical protein